jgi:hypothetical protein
MIRLKLIDIGTQLLATAERRVNVVGARIMEHQLADYAGGIDASNRQRW